MEAIKEISYCDNIRLNICSTLLKRHDFGRSPGFNEGFNRIPLIVNLFSHGN